MDVGAGVDDRRVAGVDLTVVRERGPAAPETGRQHQHADPETGEAQGRTMLSRRTRRYSYFFGQPRACAFSTAFLQRVLPSAQRSAVVDPAGCRSAIWQMRAASAQMLSRS